MSKFAAEKSSPTKSGGVKWWQQCARKPECFITPESATTITDAKEVLRSMLDNDELDKKMEQMFLLSGAMFAMSANYLIGTSLLRHPNEYRKMVSGQTNVAAAFRQQPNVQAMKNYVLHAFKDDGATSKSLSRKASTSLTKEFLESSDDEANDEQPLQPSTSQKKRISSTKQQQKEQSRKASPPKASQQETTSPTKVSPKQSKRKASIHQLADKLEEEVKAPEVKTPKRKQSKK